VEQENRSRRLIPVVFLFVTVLLGVGASSVPLFDPDEARFARTSLEMQRSGDLVVPTFEGRPRLVKPPLFHWIQSTLFSVLGTREWVVRLPSLLATLATLWLTAAVARRRFGEQGAFWAVVCLATMPLVVVLGRIGTLDALLTLHVWAVVAYDLDERPSPWPYGLLLGLAFLIKGPVGVVVPLLMILAGRTASGRPVAPSLRGLAAGVAAWALVVLPWGLLFLGRVGGTAIDTLKNEVWSRVGAGTDHVEPFWFYLPLLFLVCLPWFVPFVSALFRVFRMAVDPASRTARYLAAAWLAGIVLLSLSRGKLPNYVLPLLPAMAALCSWELARQLEVRKRTRVPALLASTLGIFAIGFGVAGAGQPAGPLRTAAWVGAVAYGLATVASMPFLLRRRPLRVWQLAASAQAVFLLGVVILLPAEISRTRTTAWLVEAVPDLGQDRPVAMVDMKVPSLTWYLDRVPEEIDLARLGAGLDRDAGHLYLFDQRDWERVPHEIRARLRLVGEQGKYRVYERVDGSAPPG
jgi:4-amino-4-deoxy-L-arabinose transferase